MIVKEDYIKLHKKELDKAKEEIEERKKELDEYKKKEQRRKLQEKNELLLGALIAMMIAKWVPVPLMNEMTNIIKGIKKGANIVTK